MRALMQGNVEGNVWFFSPLTLGFYCCVTLKCRLSECSDVAASLFTAATQPIALKWKAADPLSLEEWISKNWHVFLLNKLTAALNRYYACQSLRVKVFQKWWFPFMEFSINTQT